MKFFVYNKKSIKILIGIMCVCIIASPVTSSFSVTKANAQIISIGGGGKIVFDPRNVLTNTLQTLSAQLLQQKELILDGLFRNIAQKALQQLTADILSFINTGGQDVNGVSDGRPTFVTDLSDELDEVTYNTGSKLIYSEALSTVCTPYQLDVNIALAAQLQFELLKPEDKLKKQLLCTIDKPGIDMSAVFSVDANEGGWSTFLAAAVHPKNTPYGAYLAASRGIKAAEAQERFELLEDIRNGNGFKSLKTCKNISTPAGTKEVCSFSTPGIALQTQMSAKLEVPTQSLLNADEFDEVIGNLFGNLANQAISGINGLLGLNDLTFGTGSNQSYFDAIKNDPTNTSSNGAQSTNPITTAIVAEQRVGKAEIGIINAINDITECSPDTVLPAELQGVLNEFIPKVQSTGNAVSTLLDMSVVYASSTSASEQAALLTQLESMRTNGVLGGLPLAIEYEQFLNFDLKDFITQWKIDTGYIEIICPTPPTP